MKINVTIPTYNRDRCIGRAVQAALDQSYPDLTVTVVDDGSQDDTREVCSRFFSRPNFCYLRLGRNVGTAKAKNVSLLLSDYDAISFHDSDDIPSRHKILLQARALGQPDHHADPILDWESIGRRPGEPLQVDMAVGSHRFIRADGSVHLINKRISLLDDFFPNLQFPSKTDGDWILVNSGLFRRSLFQKLGGYLDSIEEDRELRNRIIATGHVVYYIEEPLLDKIEEADSLTVAHGTNYMADRRRADREEVWRRNRAYKRAWNEAMAGATLDPTRFAVPVELNGVEIAEVSNPELLRSEFDIPVSSGPRWLSSNGRPHRLRVTA